MENVTMAYSKSRLTSHVLALLKSGRVLGCGMQNFCLKFDIDLHWSRYPSSGEQVMTYLWQIAKNIAFASLIIKRRILLVWIPTKPPKASDQLRDSIYKSGLISWREHKNHNAIKQYAIQNFIKILYFS